MSSLELPIRMPHKAEMCKNTTHFGTQISFRYLPTRKQSISKKGTI